MRELPELTPEHFEILVTRELRKAGLEVSALSLHRRATLPEGAGYLVELKGVVGPPGSGRPTLIACRRQAEPIGAGEVETIAAHVREAQVETGLLFGAPDFDRGALAAAATHRLALLRVTDGRTAFDTSGWGAPGHYPAWLPAYCAQLVSRDPFGEPRYALLDRGSGAGLLLTPGPTPAGSSARPERPNVDPPNA